MLAPRPGGPISGHDRPVERFRESALPENFLALVMTDLALNYAGYPPGLPWFSQVPARPCQGHTDRFGF